MSAPDLAILMVTILRPGRGGDDEADAFFEATADFGGKGYKAHARSAAAAAAFILDQVSADLKAAVAPQYD